MRLRDEVEGELGDPRLASASTPLRAFDDLDPEPKESDIMSTVSWILNRYNEYATPDTIGKGS